MVAIIRPQDILSEVHTARNWMDLYNKIANNPLRYNVHFCLVNCDRNFICRDFILRLYLNNLLDASEVSEQYDSFDDPDLFERGNRTFRDFMQYLAGVALYDRDNVSYQRYADAWNAEVDLREILIVQNEAVA